MKGLWLWRGVDIDMDFWQRQRPMFSAEEFAKIRDMVVYIAGAGGLGTHQVVELQRIGVKKIYIIDYDNIDATNLNRQILYGREDIGKSKVDVAKDRLNSFDLGTEVVAINGMIDRNTTIPGDVDIVYDALDNFDTRFILERLAGDSGLPLIHGGVSSWYGQITTIIPEETSSLQELFAGQINANKEKKEENIKDNDNDFIPVFSPIVSIVASLQVIEGVKVLLKRENTLKNKLLLIDSRDYSIDIVEI